MGAVTTAVLIGATVAATGAAMYSSVQQGKFQDAMAKSQASEMEIQMAASDTQRAAERVDEEQQRLQQARDFDALLREQSVAFATTGFMGSSGSFSAMQASDLSSYTRDQMMSQLGSGTRETLHAQKLDAMRRQMRRTLQSGKFAKRMGYIHAGQQGLQGVASAGPMASAPGAWS